MCSKREVFFGPSFAAFWLNTGKYEPEKTPPLDTFNALVNRRKKNNEIVLSGQDEGSMWGYTIIGTHFKFKKTLKESWLL